MNDDESTFEFACACGACALVGRRAAQNPRAWRLERLRLVGKLPPAACPTIRYIEKKGEGSGVGAIAGGVSAACSDTNRLGRGNTAATIVGAGAAHTRQRGRENAKKKSYTLLQCGRQGRTRTITQVQAVAREGNRVRSLAATARADRKLIFRKRQCGFPREYFAGSAVLNYFCLASLSFPLNAATTAFKIPGGDAHEVDERTR